MPIVKGDGTTGGQTVVSVVLGDGTTGGQLLTSVELGNAGTTIPIWPSSGPVPPAPTVDTNPGWGGGALLAITYHAAIGTFKPSEEPRKHREFWGGNVVVTAGDVADYKAKYIEKKPTYDWNDFWGPTTSQWS